MLSFHAPKYLTKAYWYRLTTAAFHYCFQVLLFYSRRPSPSVR